MSDFTNTLLKKKEALKGTLSEDFERDAGESLHETVIVEKRSSRSSSEFNTMNNQQHHRGSGRYNPDPDRSGSTVRNI